MTNVNDAKVLNAILNPNTPFEEEDQSQQTESKYEPSAQIDEAKQLELKVDENLADKHKKQRKELNAKIQSLKKTVTKGDRKKKKEIDSVIETLEKEFLEKCQLELSQVKAVTNDSVPSKPIVDETPEVPQKLSKAQKKRDKKEKENHLREKEIALQEIENLKGPAHIELTKIKEKLRALNLEMKEVCPDGNCMYYAVSDQLSQHLAITKSFKELRELTSSYMYENPNEFQPYLCSDKTGDPLTTEEYKEYCLKIKECLAPVWGSMTELKALSDILKISIQVIQAEGSEILIGDCDGNGRIVVTYHRHMFGSGEHYNSTCLKKANDEFEDS